MDLFGVFIPKLRNAIKAIYKKELIKPFETERTIKKRDNLYVTVYNMEVVLLLAFRLNTYQARTVRRELKSSTLVACLSKNSATKTAATALNGINSLLGGNKVSRLEKENVQQHRKVEDLNVQIERIQSDMQK